MSELGRRPTGPSGCVQLLYDWNWHDAEATLQRALQLDPADVQTPPWYALQLLCLVRGRFEDAIVQAREAMSYDPLNGYPSGGPLAYTDRRG